MFEAKVVLDSVGPNGKRLISVAATYPRFIHAEVMTHRDRERNAASSRAIPWERLLSYYDREDEQTYVPDLNGNYLHPKCMKAMILSNPVVPLSFDGEQKGMQSAGPVARQEDARLIWLMARDQAVKHAQALADLGVHKSLCNRLTEPFMWITTLMTATEWNNFFRLRCHPDAEKHFQKIAYMMKAAIAASVPTQLHAGGSHMPYLQTGDTEEAYKIAYTPGHFALSEIVNSFKDYRDVTRHRIAMEILKRVSVARCARLSYLTHEGKRSLDEDLKLFHKLIVRDDDVIHASPTGHVAEASNNPDLQSGPFRGWKQFRKQFANENVPGM